MIEAFGHNMIKPYENVAPEHGTCAFCGNPRARQRFTQRTVFEKARIGIFVPARLANDSRTRGRDPPELHVRAVIRQSR